MTAFNYSKMFPLGADSTRYRQLSRETVGQAEFNGRPLVSIQPDTLTRLTETAFKEVSHLLRTSHLEFLAKIMADPEASDNDRFVTLELLKNAVIAADMEYPMCQDTGTAIVMGKKGQQVWTGSDDEKAIAQGIYNAYTLQNLRYSQNAPLSMFKEVNTGSNLPAQIDIAAVEGESYTFLFIAKGGGSANKSYLYQETRAVLNPESLLEFITAKMRSLGTAACPPYHLVVVVGGTSAEMTLKTVKLASTGYLDQLPTQGDPGGHAFRDPKVEAQVLAISRDLGIGAQFGGKYFCHDVRVIRLPRHGASCPIGIGVSCSADRQIKAKINAEGVFLEELDRDPARFLPQPAPQEGAAVSLDLNRPMNEIRATLSNYPVTTRLALNGDIIVARDIAHARLKKRLDNEGALPGYFRDHIIYYAGPSKTPQGRATGSFGPTTAGRMDAYVSSFQKAGGSMVMLGKGNRTRQVTDACKRYGGFYLGSIGGPAARLGRDCITHMELLEYPELGMEAIYRITVKDFPAFIIVDDKGNDFFEKLT